MAEAGMTADCDWMMETGNGPPIAIGWQRFGTALATVGHFRFLTESVELPLDAVGRRV
jgi:hypothetical protein